MLRMPIAALVAALLLTVAGHGVGYATVADTEVLDTAIPETRGALGANFNQNLDSVDYRELTEAGARWVRGFYPVPAADTGDPADHIAIRTILDTAARGYHTILSLKYPYGETPFPQPGSKRMAAELARLDRILPTIMGRVDIVTIGNEPFIESMPNERDARLNEFYETIARHIVNYRREHCQQSCTTELYMGALNRLDLPDHRTPATERWMRFVRNTPDIEGVDIHPHLPSQDRAAAFLDYILPRMRADQKFLVTEFSLVWYWRQHMRDPVPTEFAEKYGYEPDTQVWQVLRDAINEPVSERQWDDFLSSCSWFTAQSSFLRDQMALYRGTGRLAVATYGFKQDEPMTTKFGPDKPPWLLNSVFATFTVRPRGELSGRGWWVDDFRTLARG